MALEDVNTNSLRNAITSCKNTINYSADKQVLNSISNEKVWKCDSSNNLKTALSKLIEIRYKNLESKLDSYYKIVSYIEDYQELYKENEKYESQSRELSNKINNSRTNMTDKNKESILRSERTMKNKLNNLKTNISHNKQQMSYIEQKIKNSI